MKTQTTLIFQFKSHQTQNDQLKPIKKYAQKIELNTQNSKINNTHYFFLLNVITQFNHKKNIIQ